MNSFGNSKKANKLRQIAAQASVSNADDSLAKRSKINFSYFDSSQAVAQDFKDWTHDQLYKLLDKFKNYTTHDLNYWRNERCGCAGLKVFSTYGRFPDSSKTEFSLPAYIPAEAQWGRFRLGNKERLIGFTLPAEMHNTVQASTGELFDKNTFYVVFLDKDHKFYKTEVE